MPITVIPYIPRTVTVHTGPAEQWAEDVTVTFPDYIKNVASSEIYPTWAEAALRANILAQVSFALNRVYTEYYRSRGYSFDITGSTMNDQKFIKGRSTFENVDRLVDELFHTYIRRRGTVEPLSARFCNGTTSTCAGLSQWGSESLAREGYSYVDILRRYYGDDIELVSNAPIRDIAESYPGTPLRRGSYGQYVTVLQVMLNRVGESYPAIGRISPVDGYFDRDTERAVITFQQVFGLAQDGIVGQATWYKLVFLYVGLNDLSELISEGQRYYAVAMPITEDLNEGDTGPMVSALQYFLSILSAVGYAVPALTIDGIYGPATRQAVADAQAALGLPITGRVNAATGQSVYNAYLSAAAALGNDLPRTPAEIEDAVAAGRYPGYPLSLGSRDT